MNSVGAFRFWGFVAALWCFLASNWGSIRGNFREGSRSLSYGGSGGNGGDGNGGSGGGGSGNGNGGSGGSGSGNGGSGGPGTKTAGGGSDDDWYHYSHRYDSDKDAPTKGSDDCKSLYERWGELQQGNVVDAILPCYNNSNRDSGDDDGFSKIPEPETAGNHLFMDLYVSLPPGKQSVGHYLIGIVTYNLNYKADILDMGVEMEYENLRSKIIYKLIDRFWWRYQFKYACFWENTTIPVNASKMEEIQNEFLKVAVDLEELQEMVPNVALDSYNQSGVLNFSFTRPQPDPSQIRPDRPPCWGPRCPDGDDDDDDDDDSPDESEHDEGDVNKDRGGLPTLAPSQQSPNVGRVGVPDQLDTGEWDWQRYTGLGLLLGTVFGTFCLAQIAGFRRRRRAKRDLWGNLATEQGVDELLRTGWKIDGSKMEVYDKHGAGYRDDDSMLMGGFEQKEQVLGTEITVTQSEMTPESSRKA